MKTNTLRTVPATIFLLVGSAGVSSAHATTITESLETPTAAEDVYTVTCAAGDSGKARVIEIADGVGAAGIGDANTLIVVINYTEDPRGCRDDGGDPLDSKADNPNGGNYSSYAVADGCGAGQHTVRIFKTHNGMERYRTQIFCEVGGDNEDPAAITNPPVPDE